MNLPEDPKERQKIYALIGIGVLVVLAGLYQGVFVPINKSKTQKLAKIEKLATQLQTARAQTATSATNKQKNRETIEEIKNVSDQYVLKARLNNYLLGAKQIIDDAANKLEIELESVSEIGISEVPAPKGKSNNVSIYTARCSLRCGLSKAIKLFNSIESANPYLCINTITIMGNSKDPESHMIRADIQWPIWSDPSIITQLDDQLNDEKEKSEHVTTKK